MGLEQTQRASGALIVGRIAMIYLGARAVTTTMLVLAAFLSGPDSRFGADATVGSFLLGWDAQWYWLLAENGYPTELPRDAQGAVQENSWAFLPLYAYTAKAVGMLAGSWGGGALIVSLLAGFGACVALHRLLSDRIGVTPALWAVALFACAPVAPLFQVGYAESLFLMLLFFALDAVRRRRFGGLYLLIPLMAFTRPGVLAFALFLGLVTMSRWLRRRRDPLPPRELAHLIATGLLAAATGVAWPLIVGAVTGVSDGYLQTELAWRSHWVAGAVEGFVPFQGWIQASEFWFARWGLPPQAGVLGLVVSVAVAALILFAPSVRRLGPEIRLWSASYVLYLLAVFFPQSSTLRLLVPLSPLWGALATVPSRAVRMLALGASLVGQWLWIVSVYAQGSAFWQVP